MIVAIVRISGFIEWEMHKFKDAPTLLNWWKDNKGTGGEFHTVNCSKPTIPDIKMVRRNLHSIGKRWCPWCADGRNFEYFSRLDVNRCTVCHVSDDEYWVRRSNGKN